MFEVKADQEKNRLYVVATGKIKEEQMQGLVARTLNEAKKLRTGFGTITDISEVSLADQDVRQLTQETMAKLKEMGMGNVVRVARVVVQAYQWQRSSHAVGYMAAEAKTMEEAEKILSHMEKR